MVVVDVVVKHLTSRTVNVVESLIRGTKRNGAGSNSRSS